MNELYTATLCREKNMYRDRKVDTHSVCLGERKDTRGLGWQAMSSRQTVRNETVNKEKGDKP